MAKITTKELDELDHILTSEQNLVTKFKHYASNTTDPKLKAQFKQIAEQHQAHFDTLMGMLK